MGLFNWLTKKSEKELRRSMESGFGFAMAQYFLHGQGLDELESLTMSHPEDEDATLRAFDSGIFEATRVLKYLEKRRFIER